MLLFSEMIRKRFTPLRESIRRVNRSPGYSVISVRGPTHGKRRGQR